MSAAEQSHKATTSNTAEEQNASGSGSRPSGFKRLGSILENKNVQTGARFFSASAKTWVGMHPIWLMGEAVTGRRVGTQFRKSGKELLRVAEELRAGIATSTKDILIVVDKHLQEKKGETVKTAELLKAAGADAIVVVSTSLVEAQAQIERSSPHLKASLLTHSKDVVIVIDKALKNPLVITGITKFAKAQGIPQPEAMLRVASLALNKVLVIINEEEGKAKEDVERIKLEEEAKLRSVTAGPDAVIVEYDAEELQRTATTEAVDEASKVGKIAEGAQQPTIQQPKGHQPEASTSKGKDKAKEKDDKCIIM